MRHKGVAVRKFNDPVPPSPPAGAAPRAVEAVSLPPQGDDDLLLAEYLRRRGNIVRFLAARAGSMAAAEDLAQELYLKLATRDRAAEIGNPSALLYRMAINLMLDRARGESRMAARDGAWRQVSGSELGGIDIADAPPADEAAASAQRLRQLVAAVGGLAPQMGRAFRLHKLEGLSHAETARAMGLSVKAVEKHVSAALKALTARLSP